MADFGAGRGKYKISLEHCVMPEGKKDSKSMAMSQGQGKGLLLAKYRTKSIQIERGSVASFLHESRTCRFNRSEG